MYDTAGDRIEPTIDRVREGRHTTRSPERFLQTHTHKFTHILTHRHPHTFIRMRARLGTIEKRNDENGNKQMDAIIL